MRAVLTVRFLLSSTISLTVLLLAPATQANSAATESWDTETLYLRACAPCHGADGVGLEPEHPNYANFTRPPADFTDPLFNSREPAADWFLVIKHGGARLGLSRQMPAYGSALSDQQINDLVTYLKRLTNASRYPPGDLNFPRPIVTTKAFPEDEVLIINRYERGKAAESDSLRTTLYYARRFGARSHAEVKLSHLHRSGGDSELDELELEFKRAVHDNLDKQILHALGIELAIPIEDDEASEELIPYWSFAKGIAETFTFQSNLRAKLPLDDIAEGKARLAAVFHWIASPWPRSVTPALELTVLEPFASGEDTQVTLIPQLYVGLSKGGHVALALGVETPLTDLGYDYRLHSFLLWDIADGPPWRGW